MDSLISVPPRSLAPATRRTWASLALLHPGDWILRNVGPGRGVQRVHLDDLDARGALPDGHQPLAYIGASW